MATADIVIIGAGLSGLSTAHYLNRECVVLERGTRAGGLATTNREGDYYFDITGHWMHMRDPEVRGRFSPLLEMPEVVRRSSIFTRGRMVAYPFQSNLKDLPDGPKLDCLHGAMEAHIRRERQQTNSQLSVSNSQLPAASFEDFVLHHFGEGIAREFMFPYNRKLWGVDPSEISHAWCQRFVPVPDLKQILAGALTDENARAGYNAAFSYPEAGGIEAFAAAVAGQVPGIAYDKQVVAVHAGEKWVETADGERLGFGHLVSTMPLKELARCWVDKPEGVADAAEKLRCTSLTYYDLGLDREVLDGLHWVYVPDPERPFYRLGCYSNARASMAPPGCSSVYVELSAGQEVDHESALDEALEVISQMGTTVGRENVAVWKVRNIDYAYVVYDMAYVAARTAVAESLEQAGIHSIGRYGKWVYASMEDAFIDGRNTAGKIAEDVS